MEPPPGGRTGPRIAARIAPRVALGRAIRDEAEHVVATRGALAEAAAWARARTPGQNPGERAFREAVAVRVSRMFAFVGNARRH